MFENGRARTELELIEEFHQDSITRLEEDRVDETKRVITYSKVGRDEMEIGSLLAVLDDDVEAKQRFTQAAVHLADSVQLALKRYESPEIPQDNRLANEPGKLIDAMYSTLLAHDSDLQTRISDIATSISQSYLESHPELAHLYYYLQTLCAIADGESRGLHLAELESSIEPLDGTDHSFFSGVLRCLKGIIQQEPPHVREGIRLLLEAESPERISAELVSVPGTALLCLARGNGLDVTVGSDRIPDTLVGE